MSLCAPPQAENPARQDSFLIHKNYNIESQGKEIRKMIIHDTLQSAGKELPLISVISSVYNTQDYLPISIESIINQTYPNWELILIDDGSTDNSTEIIKRYTATDSRIKLIQNENHGQGYERNLGLRIASGKYVMFLDSDDYLRSETMDLAVAKLEREKTDFVVFDYYYYNPISRAINYHSADPYFAEKKLGKSECLQLLKAETFYSMNKMFRIDFLKKNSVTFGEGYIYEDIEFWGKAALSAENVSLIHSPLYRITINASSSTKTKYDTDWHSSSFIKAMNASVKLLNESEKIDDRSRYNTLLYLYRKFVIYYSKRTPNRYKRKLLVGFADNASSLGQLTDFGEARMFSFLIRHDAFVKKKYLFFQSALLYSLTLKPWALAAAFKIKRKFNGVCSKLQSKTRKRSLLDEYADELEKPLYRDVILFMGFDYRYTGNSRYLFEELRGNLPDGMKVYYVTDSAFVPIESRIKPNSQAMYQFVARAKTIVFETWIPQCFKHRSESTWIQLWHGTPLKRLAFDSHEKQGTGRAPTNKCTKFNDIQRWDYLLADSNEAISYFRTCFLFPESKQLALGYPRVKYLLKHREHKEYIDFLKELYGVSRDKKIVLYLPTWRDYNSGKNKVDSDDFDLSYLVDLNRLQLLLGDEYELVYKDHVFLSKPENVNFKNYSGAETQELLLIADYLLTDYSSVMFDAMAIDIPVILYCNDFERFDENRGVYEEMWNALKPFVCDDTTKVRDMIVNYKIDEHYLIIKEKYSYNPTGESLVDFVIDKACR